MSDNIRAALQLQMSAVIYGQHDSKAIIFEGIQDALSLPDVDIRLFGKPESFKKRRMGVALVTHSNTDDARGVAQTAVSKITIKKS